MPHRKTLRTGQQPWLNNKKWANKTLVSSFWPAVIMQLAFGVIFLGIAFFAYDELKAKYDAGETILLVFLLFPLVGLLSLALAIKRLLELKRFGRVPLELDPYPGSIGGQVGGKFFLKYQFPANQTFTIQLCCVHSYVSGTGKNRSRRESILWQDQLNTSQINYATNPAHVAFLFNVPADLPASEPSAESYRYWKVEIQANLQGVDLFRQYEIPVFATATNATTISQRIIDQKKASNLQAGATRFQYHHEGSAHVYHYPTFRNVKTSIMMVFFALIFGGIPIFIATQNDDFPFFMLLIFTVVALLILCYALYLPFNALTLRIHPLKFERCRQWCGFNVSEQSIPINEVKELSVAQGSSTTTGSRTTTLYRIILETKAGKKWIIGEGFLGHGEANAILEEIKSLLKS